jgi:hypothetical protein
VADGSGADSMLQFQLKRGGDGIKHCQKMKRRQRAHLGYMGRKCDTTRQCGDIDRRRCGTGEGKPQGGEDTSWADTNRTRLKNEKNPRGRFSCYK